MVQALVHLLDLNLVESRERRKVTHSVNVYANSVLGLEHHSDESLGCWTAKNLGTNWVCLRESVWENLFSVHNALVHL